MNNEYRLTNNDFRFFIADNMILRNSKIV